MGKNFVEVLGSVMGRLFVDDSSASQPKPFHKNKERNGAS